MTSSALMTQVPFASQFPPLSVPGYSQTSSPESQPFAKLLRERRENKHNAPCDGSRSVQNSRAADLSEPSSNESIECAPCNAPQEEAQSSGSHGSTHRKDEDHPSDNAPFPLVEWMRAIRKGTSVYRPMMSLRWARVISKKQQAILDGDDSWYPPLAGKPARPGTIPVDILQELSTTADRPIRLRVQQTELEQSWPSLPPPTSVTPLDIDAALSASSPTSNSDLHTRYASDWGSSPPQPQRRQLPPDTSPVKGLQERSSAKPVSTPPRSEADNEHETPSRIASINDPNIEVSAKTSALQTIADAQGTAGVETSVTQCEQPCAEDTTPSLAEHVPIVEQCEVSSSSSSDPSDKIQIKDTPFPQKIVANKPSLQPLAATPHSSCVAATYPESNRDGRSPAELDGKEHFETTTVTLSRVNQPELAASTLKRPHNCVLPEASTHISSQHNPRPDSSAPRCYQSATEAREAKRRKRLDRARVSLSNDQTYEEIDRQRLLDRRAFRREHSKSWTNSGPEDEEAFVRQNLHGRAEGSRRSASARMSDNNGNNDGSANDHTSPTQPSITESPQLRFIFHDVEPKANKMTPVGTKWSVPVAASFRSTYPDYKGDERAFVTALRLLRSLEAQPFEPHPSLWDDFVFRMANEYRAYVRDCILDGEDVLPYQQYYHTRVVKPGHVNGILNQDNITQSIDAYQLNSPASPSIKSMKRRSPLDLRKQGAGRVSVGAPNMQVSRACGAGPQRSDALVQRLPLAKHFERNTNTSTFSKTPTQACAGKRRSLPWDRSELKTSRPASPRLTNLSEINISATDGVYPTTPSSKVERWLTSSRASGVASPELASEDATDRRDLSQDRAVRSSRAANMQVDDCVSPPPVKSARDRARVGQQSSAENDDAADAAKPRPSAAFAKFAKCYLALQNERRNDNPHTAQERIPINACNWWP